MFPETLIPSDPSVPLQFFLAAAAPIDRKGVGILFITPGVVSAVSLLVRG
jgi:hypothetical protein